MALNKERLEALADAIEVSETYNQRNWHNRCGTPACIAGHAVFMWPENVVLTIGKDRFTEPRYDIAFADITPEQYRDLWIDGWDDAAIAILGLEEEDADILFDGSPMAEDVTNAHAAYTIRDFLDSGIVDWDAYFEHLAYLEAQNEHVD